MKLIPKTAFFPRFMAGLVDWLFGWAVWVQSGGCLGLVQQRRSTGGGAGGAARNAGSPELTDGGEEGVSEYLTLSGP